MGGAGAIKRATALAAILCALCAASACSGDDCGTDCIDLSGRWTIVPRDDREAALPGYVGAGAGMVDIPGDWSSFISGNSDLTATVWLRKNVRIGARFAGKPLVLSLGRIAVADETYFNGRQVGGSGAFPAGGDPLRYGYAWQKSREYFIPAEAVRINEDNVVAVRVFSHVINGIAGDVRITDHRTWSSTAVIVRLRSLLGNEGAFILNIVLIILFLITLDWRTQRMTIVFSSVIPLIASFVHLLVLGVPAMDGLVRLKLTLFSVVLAHLVFLYAVQEFMNMRTRVLSMVSAALALGFAVFLVMTPDSRTAMRLGQPAAFALILAYALLFTGIFIRALVRDPLRYWVFIFAAIPLVASSVDISRSVLAGQTYRLTLSIVTHFPLVLTVVMVYMILHFKSMGRENISLARVILRKNQVIGGMKKRAVADEGRTVPRERINDLVDFLDANYMDAYDRRGLAKQFDFNEDYMLQLFKKTTGMTISHYINAKRIEAAKQLLAETDGKIIDIAYHVGFDNITYFHRLFKNTTGMTPREFRLGLAGGASPPAD